MSKKSRDTILIILNIFLILLISLQSYGGVYGKYTLFSWSWVILVSSPVFIQVFIISEKVVETKALFIYLIIGIGFIFLQRSINIHPIYFLAVSLLFFVPFIFYFYKRLKEMRQIKEVEKKIKENKSKIRLDSEISKQCKFLLSENKVEDVFSILIQNVDRKSDEYKTILIMNQKWKKVQRDKIINIVTNEWADLQHSRILHALLFILDGE